MEQNDDVIASQIDESQARFGGSLLESLLAVDIANDNVLSFFGPDLRPKLFLTTANCF